jgi:hypothetical protein
VNAKAVIASIFAAISIAGVADAQPPRPIQEPFRKPGYSPYLNLSRSGGNAAQNYYGLVRPELEFRKGVNQLRLDTQAIAAEQAAPTRDVEMATGHTTGFMTHLRYFGTHGARTVGDAGGPSRSSLSSSSPAFGTGAVASPRRR